jgi:hypothetical protein
MWLDTKRLIVLILGAAFVLLAVGALSVNWFHFRPLEAARQATATADAIVGSEALRRTATAEAQAGSEALERAANATATAQASTSTIVARAANATATVQAVNAEATARAVQATATAQAEALRCRDQANYGMAVASQPTLWPEPGTVWVTDKPTPLLFATWTVTNTGSCAWERVALKPVTGGEAEERVEVRVEGEPIPLREDGGLEDPVAPGQTVEIELRARSFGVWDASEVQGEWVLEANGMSFFDLPHFRVEVRDWVVPITPTATPTPTPTPTPVPTNTPVPTKKPEPKPTDKPESTPER